MRRAVAGLLPTGPSRVSSATPSIVSIAFVLVITASGFRAKQLLGGIDWWRRDGHPVAASHEPGSLLAAAE
jgi:hypothetical protein